MKKPKYKYKATHIVIEDTENDIKYDVIMRGEHTKIEGEIWVDGKLVREFSRGGGHANKTMALHAIKRHLELLQEFKHTTT